MTDTIATSPDRPDEHQTLTDACIAWVRENIAAGVFKAGARLPSVRTLAKMRGVSPFTIVQAYDRLVASGGIEARPGSGFYVRPQPEPPRQASSGTAVDLAWLMSQMLDSGGVRGPGLGILPPGWLDAAGIASALRALGRSGPASWAASGTSLGFLGLRELLQLRLTRYGIVARADQILLTSGVGQGLDLVLRAVVGRSAPVMVPEPCWFGALAMLAGNGNRVIPVPLRPDGLDLDAIEAVAARERPGLMIVSATGHNPTGLTLEPGALSRLVALARRYDFFIFEDDAYGDIGGADAVRVAALDGLDRVVYAGTFSKTLAPNIRVGFIAAPDGLMNRLTAAKILSAFTTPELNERLVHKLLLDGVYVRQVERIRRGIEEGRSKWLNFLKARGMDWFGMPNSGMFLWANVGKDTRRLASEARARNTLLAPGSLFLADQRPSSWMRVNVATPIDEALKALLEPDR